MPRVTRSNNANIRSSPSLGIRRPRGRPRTRLTARDAAHPHTETSTSDLPTDRTYPEGQNAELFQLEVKKRELELKKLEQELELQAAESRARIQATEARTVASDPGIDSSGLQTQILENTTGEFAPEAIQISSAHPGISRTQINLIFRGKFIPENLYKLRRLHGGEDDQRTHEMSISPSGALQIRKVKGTYKDFCKTPAIWQSGFVNYTAIMKGFFGAQFPTLNTVLLSFLQDILELADDYSWPDAVLPLAISFHKDVVSHNAVDVDRWHLPQLWILRYCTPDRLSKPASTHLSTANAVRPKPENKASCRNYNTKGCTWPRCSFQHVCSDCGGNHPSKTCTSKME